MFERICFDGLREECVISVRNTDPVQRTIPFVGLTYNVLVLRIISHCGTSFTIFDSPGHIPGYFQSLPKTRHSFTSTLNGIKKSRKASISNAVSRLKNIMT